MCDNSETLHYYRVCRPDLRMAKTRGGSGDPPRSVVAGYFAFGARAWS
jgi:hypothetical protein